jgi:hypothetical protein
VIQRIQASQDRLSGREIRVAKLAPQGGRVMRHFEIKNGTPSLNKVEILAMRAEWTYHEQAPSWRAKNSTIETRLILAQVGVKH